MKFAILVSYGKFCFLGRGLTIVGSILEGDFKERADDVALAKEVRKKEGYPQSKIVAMYSRETLKRCSKG